MNCLRKLWSQHVYWTRFFIISTISEAEDIEPVTERLLRNPVDFAELLSSFYGSKNAQKFQNLLTQHLMIGGELVNAAKNSDNERANSARKRWYKNADEIACYLSYLNSLWNKASWRDMLYNHLKMIEKETKLQIDGCYSDNIKLFDEIEKQAMEMADYMFFGISKQKLC